MAALILSGMAMFFALSCAPGTRLAALRVAGNARSVLAASAADALLWLVSGLLALGAMAIFPPAMSWTAGALSAVFLVGFLSYTLRRPFEPPPSPRTVQHPLGRWDLWFDAILVFPGFMLGVTATPTAVPPLCLGALVASLVLYAACAHAEWSQTPGFWRIMRGTTALCGLAALLVLGRGLVLSFPF